MSEKGREKERLIEAYMAGGICPLTALPMTLMMLMMTLLLMVIRSEREAQAERDRQVSRHSARQ